MFCCRGCRPQRLRIMYCVALLRRGLCSRRRTDADPAAAAAAPLHNLSGPVGQFMRRLLQKSTVASTKCVIVAACGHSTADPREAQAAATAAIDADPLIAGTGRVAALLSDAHRALSSACLVLKRQLFFVAIYHGAPRLG